MSVSIRLSKAGKKHAPSYRVVVTKTRNKRDGAFIDIIGHYNPSDKTKEFTLDKKLYDEWVGKGAIVSDAVKKLIDGTYEFKKYEPKPAEGSKKDDAGNQSAEGSEVDAGGAAEEVAEEAPENEEPAEETKEEKVEEESN